jgi:SNF2 family DNA or RNA helicase
VDNVRAAAWDGFQAAGFLTKRRELSVYGHQVETARTVVNDLGGNAILADEVGLGKTVEAGLVRAELMARGMRGRTLLLVPAGLVGQWRAEWAEKFAWDSSTHPANPADVVVLSLDAAKRSPLREAVLAQPWDLLVVDEAHHLKNPRTQNHALVKAVPRRHTLLLTATPLENRLNELYSLVTLVAPDVFGSYWQFYRQFVLAPRTPRRTAELKELLARVMVRHRRGDAGLRLPPREVTLLPIRPTPAERQLYQDLTDHLRRAYAERLSGGGNLLPILTLQRELCSSPHALLDTIEGADWLGEKRGALVEMAQAVAMPAKARALLDLARYVEEPLLVFTEFCATADMLVSELRRAGIPARGFSGKTPPTDRRRAIQWFGDTPRAVLVSTEAGGQGLNLQFCHNVVNYDLPWNPMRVEQRIGRVHRLGQRATCHIYNLFAMDTVEEHILSLLHEKIDLFREVVGELDVILRHLERHGGSLEGRLLNILMTAEDREEVDRRLMRLGREFRAARDRFDRWGELPPTPDEVPVAVLD